MFTLYNHTKQGPEYFMKTCFGFYTRKHVSDWNEPYWLDWSIVDTEICAQRELGPTKPRRFGEKAFVIF